MRGWAIGMFFITVLPVCVALGLAIKERLVQVRQARHSVWQHGVVFALFVLAMFQMRNCTHEDFFTGLDDAKYRVMAQAFVHGRGFSDCDTHFANLPSRVKNLVLAYGNIFTENMRPTRDGSFEIVNRETGKSRPYFLPFLPLAAAGCEWLGFRLDSFMPFLATLWSVLLCLVFYNSVNRPEIQTHMDGEVSSECKVAVWAMLCFFLLFGNLFTGWFLRGFYSDAVGGMLLSSAILLGLQQGRSAIRFGLAGFLMGLAISYHLTMSVIAIPVALVWMLREGRLRRTLALLFGAILGVLPLIAVMKWVCQPYGNFFDIKFLIRLWQFIPEIRMTLFALACLVLFGICLILAGHIPAARAWAKRTWVYEQLPEFCWWTCLGSYSVAYYWEGPIAKGFLESGLYSLPWLILGFVGLWFALRTYRNRFIWSLMACLSLVSWVFFYIKGVEIDVGVWSQRRLVAVMLCLVATVGIPLFRCLVSLRIRGKCIRVSWVLVVLGFFYYLTIHCEKQPFWAAKNDGGADFVAACIRDSIRDRLTLFDYSRYGAPFQVDFNTPIFSMDERIAYTLQHEPIMKWFREETEKRGTACAISFYPGVELGLVEDGIWLRPEGPIRKFNIHTGWWGGALGLREETQKPLQYLVFEAIPVNETNRYCAVQDKVMNRSPFGLRGVWDRQVRNGRWSREGCGILGPIPPVGGVAEMVIKAHWTAPETNWTEQVVIIQPPYASKPVHVVISAAESGVPQTVQIQRQEGEIVEGDEYTGVYRLFTQRPYDPKQYGIRGYKDQLGVVVESIRIRLIRPNHEDPKAE